MSLLYNFYSILECSENTSSVAFSIANATNSLVSSQLNICSNICKKFVGQTIIKNITKAKVSTFLLQGVAEHIEQLDENDYILCVGYTRKKGGDFQIGLTGSAKFGEDIFKAAQRETLEEMGLYFGCSSKHTSSKNKRHTSTIFTVKAENCIKINCQKKPSKKSSNGENKTNSVSLTSSDNKKQKITVLIHGNYNSIMNLLEDIPIKSCNQEGIGYHVGLKVSEANKMCLAIKNKKTAAINWISS